MNRIEEIDQEIEKLQKEKSALLILAMKNKPILERISDICEINWEAPSSIEQPFIEYSQKFADKLGKKLQSCIFDDNYCTDTDRHEFVSISDVATDLCGQLKTSPEENPEALVKLIWDRSSKTFYEAPIMEVLLHLEKWALENEKHEYNRVYQYFDN